MASINAKQTNIRKYIHTSLGRLGKLATKRMR
jgi:hypothetical protein